MKNWIKGQEDPVQKLLIKVDQHNLEKLSFKSQSSDHKLKTVHSQYLELSSKNIDDLSSFQKIKKQLQDQVDIQTSEKTINPLEEERSPMSIQEVGFDSSPKNYQRKIQTLIGITKSKLGNEKIATDQQFFNKNIKSFQNIPTFINSKKLIQGINQPPNIVRVKKQNQTIHHSGYDKRISVYIDYLEAQEMKKQQISSSESPNSKKRRQNKQVIFFKEYHDMFWSATNENEKTMFENDNLNRQNDFKYILQLETYLAQIHDDEVASVEQEQNNELNQQINQENVVNVKNPIKQRMDIQNIQSQQQRQLKKTEMDNILKENLQSKQQALIFKNKSDKVLGLIRMASKKIFNKKEDNQKKEQIQQSIEKQIRVNERDKIRQIAREISLKNSYQYNSSLPVLQEESLVSRKKIDITTEFPKINTRQSLINRNSISLQELRYNKYQSFNEERKSPIELIPNEPTSINIKQKLQSVEQKRLSGLLQSLKSLQNNQKTQKKQLNRLSKDENNFYKNLNNISKESTIKDILQGLLEKMQHNNDRNFYKNVQKSFKKQIL